MDRNDRSRCSGIPKWLSQYHWRDLEEVRLYATNWMWMYNHERPNMALDGITPKQRLAMAA
jgi:putative transposase